MKENISSRIKDVRVNLACMSLKKFGYENGVSAPQLLRIERNEVGPPEHFIRLVCLQFGVNRKWLENGTGKMTEDKKLNRQAKAAKLRPKTQRWVMGAAAILAPFIAPFSAGIAIGVGVDEIIEKMRKAYGAKTNTELAQDHLGVDVSAISHWLKNGHIPKKHIEKSIKETNRTQDYFLLHDKAFKNAISLAADFAYGQVKKSASREVTRDSVEKDLVKKYELNLFLSE